MDLNPTFGANRGAATDAAFQIAYRISSWPRCGVGSGFLAPLSATVRAVAVTIEPIPFG